MPSLGGTGAVQQLNDIELSTTFFETYEAVSEQSLTPRLTSYVRSTQKEREWRWLERGPLMRRWTGARSIARLSAKGYRMQTETWDSGLEFGTDEIRHMQTDEWRTRVMELGEEAAEHPERRLVEIIEAGDTEVCYDGLPFFAGADAAHKPVASNTAIENINDVTATEVPALNVDDLDDVDGVEFAAILIGLVKHMLGFKNEQGLPRNMRMRRFMLMVPLAKMDGAFKTFALELVNGGENNPIKSMTDRGFRFEPFVNPLLTDDNVVYLFNMDQIVRPFIFMEEVGPTTKYLGTGTEQEVLHRRHLFFVERIYDIGYGRYEGAIRATLS